MKKPLILLLLLTVFSECLGIKSKEKAKYKINRKKLGSDYQANVNCMPGYPCPSSPCMPGYPCPNNNCMPGYPCPPIEGTVFQMNCLCNISYFYSVKNKMGRNQVEF